MSLPDSGWWNLDDLVHVANRLLPQFLPDVRRDSRVREEVNPRLVRHYTGLRLLDEPLREGKEARYTRRHLLQLLVLRRLLAEGYSASAISEVTNRPDHHLESILSGGTQIEIAPASPASNPALDYLQRLGAQPAPPAGAMYAPAPPAAAPADRQAEPPTRWTRETIRPGLELHLSDDFRHPRTPSERAALLAEIERLLLGKRK